MAEIKEKKSDWYDRVFQKIAADPAGIDATKKHLSQLAAFCKGSVLDLGCGLGLLADLIGARPYVGVDSSGFAIDYARNNTINPHALFMKDDLIEFIQHPYMKFSTIVMSEVLEHISFAPALARYALDNCAVQVVGSVPTKIFIESHVKPSWTAADIVALFGGQVPLIMVQGCRNSKGVMSHWHFVFQRPE